AGRRRRLRPRDGRPVAAPARARPSRRCGTAGRRRDRHRRGDRERPDDPPRRKGRRRGGESSAGTASPEREGFDMIRLATASLVLLLTLPAVAADWTPRAWTDAN